jgi:hypothetical protein
VIEKILRHCGLWRCSAPRAPPAGDGSVRAAESASSDNPMACSDEVGELAHVDIDTFLATLIHRLLRVEAALSVAIRFPITRPAAV